MSAEKGWPRKFWRYIIYCGFKLLQKFNENHQNQEKLTESRQTISELESQLKETGSQLVQIQKTMDAKRGEVEKLTLQLSEISGNAMTSAKSLTSRNDSLQKMVSYDGR